MACLAPLPGVKDPKIMRSTYLPYLAQLRNQLRIQLGFHFPRELLSVCHRERSGLPGWVGLVVLFLLSVVDTHTHTHT
jgi:hypothetical protein